MKETMLCLETRGPRRLGTTFVGLNLDEFPLQPGKAAWVREVTNDDGTVTRYMSDQSASVPHDELDWGDPI